MKGYIFDIGYKSAWTKTDMGQKDTKDKDATLI